MRRKISSADATFFILKAVILTTINVNYVMIDELIHYNYKYNSIQR